MRERVGVALILVSLLGCGVAQSEELRGKPAERTVPESVNPPGNAAPEFMVSSDPAEAVIRVAYGKSFLMGLPASTYTLYGDGRLELTKTQTRTDAGAPPLPPARSVLLDADEMHALAALAANPLLIEGKREDLAKQFETAGSLMRDSGVVTVDVRLVSYSRGPTALGPVERTFRMVDPVRAAQHQLGGEAVQALAAIVSGIARLHSAKGQEQ